MAKLLLSKGGLNNPHPDGNFLIKCISVVFRDKVEGNHHCSSRRVLCVKGSVLFFYFFIERQMRRSLRNLDKKKIM